MKTIPKHPVSIVVCCSLLVGCVSIQGMNTPRSLVRATHENDTAVKHSDSSYTYLSKASEYETKGDLRMAFFYLTIAASLSPEEKEVSERLSKLQKRIHEKADLHFKEGITLYRRQQMEKARQAFLNTLRYDPKHKKAMHYLTSKFSPFKSISYTVEKGDTKTDIANKVFFDPDKAFLISYFYEETGNQDILQKGMTLDLPYLESIQAKQQTKKAQQSPETPPPVQEAKKAQQSPETPPTDTLELASLPAFNIELELAKAEGLLKEKRYDDALVIADKILDHDYVNLEAEDLINKVYYQKGNDLFEQGRYLDAQTVFGYIDPELISTQEILAEIKTILHKQAETHYLKGVKFFINEELENAILEWETVLKLNPEHEKAQSDIQNATHLLKKLQEIE